MVNKIKLAVLEMLRMGGDPHEILAILSRAYHDLDSARDYVPTNDDVFEYHKAIKDADFRP